MVVAVVSTAVIAIGLVWWGRYGRTQDVSVGGRVTVGDEPLAHGLVIFYPDAARGNHSPSEPRGRTDKQGAYQLRTEGRKGVALGWYRVAVVPRQPDPGAKAAVQAKIVAPFDRRYENPAISGLEVLVTADSGGTGFDFRLARASPKK